MKITQWLSEVPLPESFAIFSSRVSEWSFCVHRTSFPCLLASPDTLTHCTAVETQMETCRSEAVRLPRGNIRLCLWASEDALAGCFGCQIPAGEEKAPCTAPTCSSVLSVKAVLCQKTSAEATGRRECWVFINWSYVEHWILHFQFALLLTARSFAANDPEKKRKKIKYVQLMKKITSIFLQLTVSSSLLNSHSSFARTALPKRPSPLYMNFLKPPLCNLLWASQDGFCKLRFLNCCQQQLLIC